MGHTTVPASVGVQSLLFRDNVSGEPSSPTSRPPPPFFSPIPTFINPRAYPIPLSLPLTSNIRPKTPGPAQRSQVCRGAGPAAIARPATSESSEERRACSSIERARSSDAFSESKPSRMGARFQGSAISALLASRRMQSVPFTYTRSFASHAPSCAFRKQIPCEVRRRPRSAYYLHSLALWNMP